MMKRYLLMTLLLIGCSTNRKAKQKTQSSAPDHAPPITKNAMINLVRTTYIKGCVDAKISILNNPKLYPYSKCVELGRAHAKEMETILFAEESNPQKSE